jgi:pyruvate dehydrogenase E1 component alpha subunit
VDGTDVLAVYREAKRAIEQARAGGGPTLIESLTLRMEGHAVHDDASYVPRELLSAWEERDPVWRYRLWLAENVDFTEAEDEDLRAEVKALLADALRRAEASPLPEPASLVDGVYA